MSGFLSVGYFLVTLFFSLIFFVLWARVALRYFRVSSLHTLSRAVNTFTGPLIDPLERLIYPKNTPIQRYDWLALALIFVLELFKFIILGLILYGTLLPISYLLLFAVTDFIVQPCNLLFYLILIRVVVSWVNPGWQHPVADIINRVTNPLLQFGRRLVPDISGFDFSPFIIMVILKVITLFMSASMPLKLI